MPKLIIVESPSKARTLSKFLGSAYTIKASMGHVRDLPKSRLGVDVDAGFTPEYEVTKEAQVKELTRAAKSAQTVYLASDPDREGEAIAWHLADALKLADPERIVFREVTKGAVEAALGAPRKIDRNLVAAQEARRVIDRLLGYQLSPLLWKKVRTGLSAGRVQSVAVRLVVDRENEIDAFVTEEWWTLDARLTTAGGAELTARLHARRGDTADDDEESADAPRSATAGRGKLVLADEASALDVMRALGIDADGRPGRATPPFRVSGVTARQVSRTPPPPYTTSTMQQDASTRLRLSPARTMSIAQQLYEGVELGSEGPVGLITYMRTDSTRVSDGARVAASAFIGERFGTEYAGGGSAARRGKSAAPVQDAHEAVRPTDPSRTPESLADHLDARQRGLYELIWRRFVASQMAPARFDTTRVDIEAGDYVFRASGSVLRFDGFLRVLRRDEEDDRSLPALTEGDELRLLHALREQHFTQPPPRYTEASLVKELEERGIGRPSTYAATIDVIQERKYVRQEERRLHPTELGRTVDGVLRDHFPDVVDVAFTAELEKRLDGIEEGQRGYEPTVSEWYGPFHETLVRAQVEMERVRVPARETGETCPKCEVGMLVIREGKFGEFTGCSRYPECDYVKRDQAQSAPTGETCPQCGRELVTRQGRRGPFVGCSGYPECRFVRGDAASEQPAPEGDLGACPQCERPLARKMGRRGPFIGCSGYPECSYIQPRSAGQAASAPPQPVGRDCPECGKPLLLRTGRRGAFIGCSGYPKCRHTETGAAEGAGQAAGPGDATGGAGSGGAAAAPAVGECPECGRALVERKGRWGPFISCSGYPDCKYRPPRTERAARKEPAGSARTV